MKFDQKAGGNCAADSEPCTCSKEPAAWNRSVPARIVRQEGDGAVLCAKNAAGEMKRIRYRVFPGIDLIYNDIHAKKNPADKAGKQRNLLEIDHCRDGRMECHTDGAYFYLAPGDMAIHRFEGGVREKIFPTGRYHGITIQIDLDHSPKCLSCFLEDVNVQPTAIAEKYLPAGQNSYIVRQLPAVEHIFSELYALPDTIQKGYFKVKILELFLFLAGLERKESLPEQKGLAEHQVILAQNIYSYLTEHIEQRLTIAELAEQFGVSASQIKNSFAGVYGITVHAYMRGHRMRAAAELLRTTNRTVLDIASQFGYDNASKFANAFRSVMGVTPAQYRKGIIPTK
jgi:AraC-like DNA-binding protein